MFAFVFALRTVVVMALAAGLGAGVVTAQGEARMAATQPVSIRLIEMLDADHGYALSGKGITNSHRLLWTTDGGHIWRDAGAGDSRILASSPVTIIGTKTRLFSTTLSGDRFAVERSDDAGITWHRSLPFRDSHGAPAIAQPFAIDKRHLYVAVQEGAAAGSSGEALFTSSDGGHSWKFVSRTDPSGRAPHLLPFGCDKNGFGFATSRRGWAGAFCAGGQPFFYRTEDGGHTWRRQALPAPQQCACETSAPRFFTPRDGVLYVNGFTANGGGKPFTRLYWTSDGGEHWKGSVPSVGRTARIVFSDEKTVWLTAQKRGDLRAPFNRLGRTTNAGASWQTTKLHFDASNYLLDPISGTTAFAASADYLSHTILLTRDGGRSWKTVVTGLAR
jgi:photosystem II stability/assembly factor-like uncharacterized protein